MSVVWSHFQERIFDDAENTSLSLAVIARAGSGKTTTLIESARRAPIRGRMGIVAFARRSKERIVDAKPPGHYELSTLHSMGLALLRRNNDRVRVDNDGSKLRDIVQSELPREPGLHRVAAALVKAAKTRLIDSGPTLRRMACEMEDAPQNPDDINALVAGVQRALFVCRERDDVVDFDDMIWLPIELGLGMDRYRTLFIDEVQDLTRAQIALSCSVCQGGRIIGFGDPAQAIYQFAGADADAFVELEERIGAVTRPLSISYRCPRTVVREARRFVSDIEWSETAPEGIVRDGDVVGARPGDLVLSRTNAPLLQVCLDFIRRGIPAVIAGKSLGHSLESTIDKSGAGSPDSFFRWLDGWAKREAAKVAEDEDQIERIADRVACFRALGDRVGSIQAMKARIGMLFAEARGAAVTCSTVHQMKGEEADRVFVLIDSFRRGEPGSEEANLRYVAITRARRELVYVRGIR